MDAALNSVIREFVLIPAAFIMVFVNFEQRSGEALCYLLLFHHNIYPLLLLGY
jgi:hypothetical protein